MVQMERNILLNGTSFTGITASGTYPVDRFLFHVGSLGTWTLTQSTDVPTGQGFSKSTKLDCTTADGTIGADQYAAMVMFFEGQNLQLFKKGTSNAEKFTLAFWVKSTKTGTFIAELYGSS
mgnify:CR=1 FL=1